MSVLRALSRLSSSTQRASRPAAGAVPVTPLDNAGTRRQTRAHASSSASTIPLSLQSAKRPQRHAGLRRLAASSTSAASPDLSEPEAPADAVPSDAAAAAEEEETEAKSDEYSTTMQSKMGGTLVYRHEDGINYNYVLDDLIVGSCLQTPEDVDLLAEKEGVTTVFSLQEDCDMEYFGLDIAAIQARCKERGDIQHVRFPVRDFDPQDLRRRLPKAISRLARSHDPNFGKIYIHCTAGMGRAPGTALAYMYWLRGMSLDDAWQQLRAVRACNPKLEAIRGATADLLLGLDPIPVTLGLKRNCDGKDVQVAGLDVGWHTTVPLSWDRRTSRYVLERTLVPGRYQYKFVVDGHWTYSADHPTMDDGGHTNNWLEVLPHELDAAMVEQQTRLLQPGGNLLPAEREELANLLCPWR